MQDRRTSNDQTSESSASEHDETKYGPGLFTDLAMTFPQQSQADL